MDPYPFSQIPHSILRKVEPKRVKFNDNHVELKIKKELEEEVSSSWARAEPEDDLIANLCKQVPLNPVPSFPAEQQADKLFKPPIRVVTPPTIELTRLASPIKQLDRTPSPIEETIVPSPPTKPSTHISSPPRQPTPTSPPIEQFIPIFAKSPPSDNKLTPLNKSKHNELNQNRRILCSRCQSEIALNDAIVQEDSKTKLVYVYAKSNHQELEERALQVGGYKPMYSIPKTNGKQPPLKIGLSLPKGKRRKVYYPDEENGDS